MLDRRFGKGGGQLQPAVRQLPLFGLTADTGGRSLRQNTLELRRQFGRAVIQTAPVPVGENAAAQLIRQFL